MNTAHGSALLRDVALELRAPYPATAALLDGLAEEGTRTLQAARDLLAILYPRARGQLSPALQARIDGDRSDQREASEGSGS